MSDVVAWAAVVELAAPVAVEPLVDDLLLPQAEAKPAIRTSEASNGMTGLLPVVCVGFGLGQDAFTTLPLGAGLCSGRT